MAKKYVLTPKGFFIANSNLSSEQLLSELNRYLVMIKRNALIFTKDGEAIFTKVRKVK